MRAILLALLALLLFAAPAEARVACATGGGRTEAANESVRVFGRVAPFGERGRFACSLSSGRVRRLSSPAFEAITPRVLALAGHRILYLTGSSDRSSGGSTQTLIVLDVRRGRVERRWTFRDDGSGLGGPGFHGARLERDGSAAFLVGPLGRSSQYEIHRADARGKVRVTTSPEIDPASFASSRSRIYWTQAGAPVRADFAPRLVPAPPDRSAPSRCSVPRSRTVVVNEVRRVYRVRGGDVDRSFACRLADGVRTELSVAAFSAGSGLVDARLAGRAVLLVKQILTRSNADVTLLLTARGPDGLRTRWYVEEYDRGILPSLQIRGSSLRPDGAAAFLAGPVDPRDGGPRRFEVHSGGGGVTRLLDAAPDIDPASFAAGPSRIYWARGGEIRSAGF